MTSLNAELAPLKPGLAGPDSQSALPVPMTTLDQLPDGAAARVHAVLPATSAPDWPRWLAEIGFLPGEPVRLLSRAQPGGDPLVVRVGLSTFALRRAEAACVTVDLA